MNVVSTASEAMSANDKPAERRWRRLSLVALVLLLPAAYAAMSWQSITSLLANEDLIARDVAWGAEAQFGGSGWRLLDLRAALGMEGLPENAVPVLADFSVKVGNPDLQNLWLGCRIALVDAKGRSWLPTPVGLRLPDDVMGCSSAIFSGAKTGGVLKVSETFLVPRDATTTIRPTVGLGSERPFFLRFARPPS
jgi:hypothetical protein